MRMTGLLLTVAVFMASLVAVAAAPNDGRGGGAPDHEFAEDVFMDFDLDTHSGPGPEATTESNRFSLVQGGISWASGDDVEFVFDGPSEFTDDVLAGLSVVDGHIMGRDFVQGSGSINPCTGQPNSVSFAAIDGPGGTLAFAGTCRNVATKAIVGFRVVFDSAETWTATGETPIDDVRNATVHEFGHVAGLGHVMSPRGGCLTMYPYIGIGETHKRTLGLGDKLGLDALYGSGNTGPGPGCGN